MSTAPRTWLVTGSSSGLGRALTEALLRDGHRVAATVRDTTRLNDLKDTYNDRLWTADLDVTDTTRLRHVVDTAFSDLGDIDHIVSNAAFGLYGAAEELDDQGIDQLLAANLVAPVQLLRSVLPHLRRQGSGHFTQISSTSGQTGMAGASLYHASKWGVEGFFESLHDEVAPFGVGITIVEPGSIDSNFFARLNVAEPIDAYDSGPVGDLHRYLADAAAVKADSLGDPAKMARAIIEAATSARPPRRLVLGSDSYTAIEQALSGRLAALRAQEEVARSTNR
ncbi:SDR family oxidoreductase [Streptomyces kunmingensis]|uniref:SDR family oxidoreductase n=1 Tax=Streptomyces kunmingensis TaxID=68225 RepID=A0ABU6CK76_9ACTN|nr:SDR family oxidoreductase [Streptomyces kunmingensis]MEB3965108.1 SDR family oxidoreductase [Streptomyces kunmingensis]